MMDRFTADLKEIWLNLGLKLNPVSAGIVAVFLALTLFHAQLFSQSNYF